MPSGLRSRGWAAFVPRPFPPSRRPLKIKGRLIGADLTCSGIFFRLSLQNNRILIPSREIRTVGACCNDRSRVFILHYRWPDRQLNDICGSATLKLKRSVVPLVSSVLELPEKYNFAHLQSNFALKYEISPTLSHLMSRFFPSGSRSRAEPSFISFRP